MYYNSHQNNNDYYSAYKEEMANANKAQKRPNPILKIGLIILFLGLLALGALYFFNYFESEIKENSSTLNNSKIAQTTTEQIKEVSNTTQTQVVQNSSNDTATKETISSVTNSSNISPKDIELIVKIIMSQMNQAPQKELPTETSSNLEEELVAAEKQVMPKQTLKESNHYNKVVISSNEPVTDTYNKELTRLQNSLNDVLEEKSENSDYSKAISKEVVVRSNEMRVIVVQKGDTLSKIAKKAYGNQDEYIKIFNANPEIVKNPNEIYVGQRLRIPS